MQKLRVRVEFTRAESCLAAFEVPSKERALMVQIADAASVVLKVATWKDQLAVRGRRCAITRLYTSAASVGRTSTLSWDEQSAVRSAISR